MLPAVLQHRLADAEAQLRDCKLALYAQVADVRALQAELRFALICALPVLVHQLHGRRLSAVFSAANSSLQLCDTGALRADGPARLREFTKLTT
jgi:hypothetical protein